MTQLENFRLKVFRAVAEHLNFRKAAEHLFLTQPAVTQQIKALEEDLGVRLFDRAAGGVSLTRQGRQLLEHAREIAAIVVKAELELRAGEGLLSGELALGVSTTIAQYILPRLLGAFLHEHPHVQFSLRSGNTSEIVELVVQDKVAIGLVEGPTPHREVRAQPFMQDELVLITTPEFGPDQLRREQLVRTTLLMREHGSGSRRVVEAALEEFGAKLKSFERVMNLDSTEAIKSAVEAGLGVGFVSHWAICKELELGALKVVRVNGLRVTRHFALISRTGPEPQGAPGAFRDFALDRARLLSRSPRTRKRPSGSTS